MSLVDKIYLDSVVAIFIAFPSLLLWVWVTTKGWRHEPIEIEQTSSGEQAIPESRTG